jgi:hypothetical protein
MLVVCGGLSVAAEQSTLVNPTKRQYQDEAVRLKTPAPGPAGTFVVKEDGKETPYQVEQIDGKPYIWVCSSFDPGATHTYEVAPGKPAAARPRVTVKKESATYLLDNGQMAVKVPAEAGAQVPGPVAGVKLGDRWVGASFWNTPLKLKRFDASVIGDGTVLGKIRLRYEFDGMAGLDGDVPAFAEVDVALGPGWGHVELVERHEMPRGSYWEFDASKGWTPRQGLSKPYGGGFGTAAPPPARALRPVEHTAIRGDMYINLFPRWNQGCKDGWFFAATDGQNSLAATVARASRWVWPHNNAIEIIVKPGGDYAGFRAPTWKGRRLWWIRAGAALAPDIGYVMRYALESLDKLNHEFILEWPGAKGGFSGINPYEGGQVNPTGGIRGRRVNVGAPGGLSELTNMQVMLHGDTYGSYWNFWSPENPNFFTDFMRIPIQLATQLKAHPRFEELRKMAELKFKEDLYHSVTLPGGASQECPGYLGHALGLWGKSVEACRQNLGFDPSSWERFQAAQRFLRRISQPAGAGRLWLHMGDTHPGGHWTMDVPEDEVKKFGTEELPGFGVIFNNKPGTPDETYLAFKSGPNRGHYHGDQLAFHYCAHARAVAVDHHCSYGPRAGQEHMHNRVAFFTDTFPYANMDGYERLIAFKTSPDADIAVGQVESERLRQVKDKPSETWHQEYPQIPLAKPLCYRRALVFMKNGPQDYFVIRDQYWAPVALNAAYCLHVLGDKIEHSGQTVDFGTLTLFCAQPARFKFVSFPWSHANGPPESTQGARLEINGRTGEFITIIYPGRLPAVSVLPNGVRVGEDELTFAGDQPTAGDAATHLTVKRGGKELLTLAGTDINLDRSQGEIGLFVPDAGYPFGEIPDWLIRQRGKRPDWAK